MLCCWSVVLTELEGAVPPSAVKVMLKQLADIDTGGAG